MDYICVDDNNSIILINRMKIYKREYYARRNSWCCALPFSIHFIVEPLPGGQLLVVDYIHIALLVGPGQKLKRKAHFNIKPYTHSLDDSDTQKLTHTTCGIQRSDVPVESIAAAEYWNTCSQFCWTQLNWPSSDTDRTPDHIRNAIAWTIRHCADSCTPGRPESMTDICRAYDSKYPCCGKCQCRVRCAPDCHRHTTMCPDKWPSVYPWRCLWFHRLAVALGSIQCDLRQPRWADHLERERARSAVYRRKHSPNRWNTFSAAWPASTPTVLSTISANWGSWEIRTASCTSKTCSGSVPRNLVKE